LYEGDRHFKGVENVVVHQQGRELSYQGVLSQAEEKGYVPVF